MTTTDFREALHEVTSPKRAIVVWMAPADVAGRGYFRVFLFAPGRPTAIVDWTGRAESIRAALLQDGYSVRGI